MRTTPGAAILAIKPLLRSLLLGAAIAASLSWHSSCFSANLYKWVDDKGQVHYSDAVPPDAINKKRDVIDQKGVVIDEIGAAKTKAQSKEERRRKKQEAIRRQQLKAQQEHDRLLLQTYTSEGDIVNMRDRRISTIDDKITLNKDHIDKLKKDLVPLRKQIAAMQQNGKEIPADLRDKVREIEDHISLRIKIIKQQRDELKRVREQFQKDLERFRTLTVHPEPAERQVSTGSVYPPPHP